MKKQKVLPSDPSLVFKFLIPVDKIKVVILGQDPYPQPNVATGIAFGVNQGIQPSLQILHRELSKEYTGELDTTLEHWVNQGVLLVNSSLTCEEWKAGCHLEIWEEFMVDFIKLLSDLKLSRESMDSIVFVGLGKHANELLTHVNKDWHTVINRNHPAAETHGSLKFEGFFKEVNNALIQHNLSEIEWLIPIETKDID